MIIKIKIMSIIVNLTEEEIMGTPNDMELGEKARQKYWIEKEHESLRDFDEDRYVIVTDENGLVKGIHLPSEDPYVQNGYDKCVVCGKLSPYKTTTNIDLRIGYVEGAGQGCFQDKICEK